MGFGGLDFAKVAICASLTSVEGYLAFNMIGALHAINSNASMASNRHSFAWGRKSKRPSKPARDLHTIAGENREKLVRIMHCTLMCSPAIGKLNQNYCFFTVTCDWENGAAGEN